MNWLIPISDNFAIGGLLDWTSWVHFFGCAAAVAGIYFLALRFEPNKYGHRILDRIRWFVDKLKSRTFQIIPWSLADYSTKAFGNKMIPVSLAALNAALWAAVLASVYLEIDQGNNYSASTPQHFFDLYDLGFSVLGSYIAYLVILSIIRKRF